MYLGICDDNREDLDRVCGLIDAWQEGSGAPAPRRTFQSSVELLEAARQERFTVYMLDVMRPQGRYAALTTRRR